MGRSSVANKPLIYNDVFLRMGLDICLINGYKGLLDSVVNGYFDLYSQAING